MPLKCDGLIRAEANIEYLHGRDVEQQQMMMKLSEDVGKIKGYTEKLVLYNVPKKEQPDEIRNGNHQKTLKLSIKEHKWKFFCGIITVIVISLSLVSSFF